MMYSLVYVSSAVKKFSQEALHKLLALSAETNVLLGITGMLLYKDGNFMQVLEGDEKAVQMLYSKIRSDVRHSGVMTLVQGPQNERHFPDWSMGFRDLHSAEALATPGYSEFLNTPLTDEEFSNTPTRCHKLLMTFKKNM
jgi:hypothetical protein